MTDRVQQVRLSAPGAAMNEERIEADRLRRGERARSRYGNLVRLADDEHLEPVTRIEVRRVRVTLGGGWRLFQDEQRRGPRSVGRGNEPHVANDRQDRLPSQRQALAEMRSHPVRHELARQHHVERAAVRLECPEFSRLQPAIKRSCPHIPPQSAADRFPGSLERCGNSPPDLFRRRIRPCALHWPASPSPWPPKARQNCPVTRNASRASWASFLSCARRGFASGRLFLKLSAAAFKCRFFTQVK